LESIERATAVGGNNEKAEHSEEFFARVCASVGPQTLKGIEIISRISMIPLWPSRAFL
jgi:hypothetical protein